MNPLLYLSGTELARRIRKREVSSLEVVEAHMDRIQKVNPILNAVVRERFEKARSEAKVADALLKKVPREKLPPFHGVPCTIKEQYSLTGMPHTSGLVARKGIVAGKDATAVARLRKAGAIPMGVTNLSELCMWMETDNRVYGRTNNPYNPKRTAGGSSGGEGAIISAGGSPFGLGGDIGGSIRMPSFFNGIFGHKPTGGLVPATGQYPIAEREIRRYSTTGPMARRAEDLWPLLRILAGPDGKDGGCLDMKPGDPSKVRLKGLKVLVVEDNGCTGVDEDLKAAQGKVARALSKKGARIEKARFAGLKKSFEIWSSMLADADPTPFGHILGNGRPIHPGLELLKWVVRLSPHTFPAIMLAALEKILISPSRVRKFVAMGRELRQELTEAIGPNGVLLYPPYPTPAPRHYKPMFPPFNWVYTGIFNVMEFPATAVPLGLNQEGLPLGVQVVGIGGNDHLTIRVAMELEKVFGGWHPPKNL